MREVSFVPTFEGWRNSARSLIVDRIEPINILWSPEDLHFQPSLFNAGACDSITDSPIKTQITAPRAFLTSAKLVACHRDPARWSLLYRLLWRLNFETPKLLDFEVDEDVIDFRKKEKSVARDLHKMKAFVRFRRVDDHYIAWHQPDFPILSLAAPFFARRFAGMRWSILTPEASAHWDLERLTFGAGAPRSEAPSSDELEELWVQYYRSIFNPARIKLNQMRKEMPKRYWSTLPEAQTIDMLLRDRHEVVQKMIDTRPTSASHFLPADRSLASLQQALKSCEGCPLYQSATQAVPWEGPSDARLAFIGEQPGDEEDLQGRVFVGPAGQELDRAFHLAEIRRSEVFITNAVKHFKWVRQGKRRLHQRPSSGEVFACRPWLAEEMARVRPKILVLLGATAAQSVFGKTVRLADVRGQFHRTAFCDQTLVTIHPSYLLRLPDPAQMEREREEFVQDLIAARTAAVSA